MPRTLIKGLSFFDDVQLIQPVILFDMNIIQHFELGLMSVVWGIFFFVLVIGRHLLVTFANWTKREPPPKDRVLVIAGLAAIFGVVVGSLFQPIWDQGVICEAQGQPVVPCVLSSESHSQNPI